jgi:endonuclease/exonuclease/phosphatase family metal-dependent hydrolase
VVSYNVRYFGHALRGLASTRASQRRIAARLAALEPAADLVCLQEIETRSLRSRLAIRGKAPATQLEDFMDEVRAAFLARDRRSSYLAFYFPAHAHRLRGVPITTAGLAVLVNERRLRVEGENSEAPHAITHHHVVRFKERKQARICAHVELRTAAGLRLHLFNTHLSLPTPFARAFWAQRRRLGYGSNQLAEARTLAAFVKRRAGEEPFLVCGDFNSAPGSPVYRFLRGEAGFAAVLEQFGQVDQASPGDFPTAGFFNLRMHLDHLFCGNGVTFLDLEGTRPFGARGAPFTGLSDHVPLIGRLRVGSPGRTRRPTAGPRSTPAVTAPAPASPVQS